MSKIIKKLYKYFIIVTVVLILVPSVIYLLLRSSEVQTFVAKRITGYISEELKSTISVGKVNFSFLNKLVLENILINDQNNDTLLYIPKVMAGIRQINLKKSIIRVGRVIVLKPVVAFETDSSGQLNLTWYLDKLQKKIKTAGTKKSLFSINQIDVSDARFSLRNKTGTETKIPVDFNNLKISGLNAIIENLIVENDSTSFDIYNLGFKESTGFVVKKMNGNLSINKQNIIIKDMNLYCDSSIINANHIGILADSTSGFKNFVKKVRLDILLEKSLLSSSDLKYFLPVLQNINESLWLSGKVTGTVSELKGRKIILSYKNNTKLDCNFDFSGLPDINNTFIYIDVNEFLSNSEAIEQIIMHGKGHIKLPEFFPALGNISSSGSFTGFTTDFVAYGALTTSLGVVSADISFRPEKSHTYRVKGLVRGKSIDLGSLTDNPKLFGKLSMEANIDGDVSSLKKFAVNMASKVESIELNSYRYSNILMNGFFTEKKWDGTVQIDDENIRMDLKGLFDFSKKLPEFNFTMNLIKSNLYKLNIDRTDSTAALSMSLTANFKGNSIDNLDGEIKLLNSNFIKYDKQLKLGNFTIKTYIENNLPVINLQTDFFDANLKGRYSLTGLDKALKSTLASLMPVQFSFPKEPINLRSNSFTFYVKSGNTDELNQFFRTGIQIADSSFIKGSFFSDSIISVSGMTKMLAVSNNVFRDFSINASIIDSVLNADLKSSSFSFSGFSYLKNFNVTVSTEPDNFKFLVNWDNNAKILNKGKLFAVRMLTKNPNPKGKSLLRVNLDSTNVYIRNNLWKIYPSEIYIDSTSIKIGKLFIRNNENFYLVNGAVSQNPSDTLNLTFKGIDLDVLNYLYEKSNNDPNKLPLNLKGNLNGNIAFTNVYKNFTFGSNLKVKDFSLLGSNYGEISLESVWNKDRKVADIRAVNNLDGIKMFDIGGFYDPDTKKIDLVCQAKKLPVGILNTLLKVFASGINGYASGLLNFTGEIKKPYLTGALMVDSATIQINYLKTKYTFNDSIRFDKSGIKFKNIKLLDEKGNSATINGSVYHKYLKEFTPDLVINTNNCMVLKTKPKDNQMYFGTAFATGVTSIKSDGSLLSIDISAKTGKNTSLSIPINYGMSVSDFSFINFHGINREAKTNQVLTKITSNPQPQVRMELNFDLNITPDAEVQLIMDEKAGDVIKGHGRGNLNLSLDKKGEFKISGDYIIEDADYLFTLGNIFNKSFKVENGKISFNGNVMDAEIDINAIYRTSASLYDIMPGVLNEEKRIPVECRLNLTGKLFKPTVGPDIFLPTADEETRAYLKSMINSEEEMSKQFAFLIVMNSFLPTSQVSTAKIGPSAANVTTMEMLSNQISNWLSQLSNDFDIGVVYRPGSAALPNSQEVQVALSTQVLNDKVVINGNFDYGGIQSKIPGSSASSASNAITGAFVVEYKINEKIRFKVFNRSNDNFSFDNGIQYTQGVGLFYRQDFDKFKDLFKRPVKGEMKKEKKTKAETQ